MSATLELRGLHKRFGDEVAVDGVSLTVVPGELVSILGPSGSGKSTILRLVAGLETPDRGAIMLDGADVTALPAHRRSSVLVFQQYALFPHLSARDNVGFGLAMRKVPASAIAGKVEAILERVGLVGHGDKRPGQLSGGQQQRVALARALILDPAVLLLDEPFGALDLALRRQLQGELREIQRQSGQTVLHVTHDQAEALALSDRVVVLHQGRVVQVGPPAEIYERPATRFVARFMDVRNIVPVERVPGSHACLLGQYLPLPHPEDVPDGPLVAAIRPEHVTLDPEPGGAEALAWPVTVRDVTYAGTTHIHTVATAGGTVLEAHAPVAYPAGTALVASVDPRHVVILGA